MAQNVTARELDVRRPPDRAGAKGIAELVADILRDAADLFRAEMQLLQAELAEKVTSAALSLCVIAAGALLLLVTIVLLLQAAISELVAYGWSWSAACLIVSGLTFVVGAGLTWYGVNRLSNGRIAPARTIDQLKKDINIANMG